MPNENSPTATSIHRQLQELAAQELAALPDRLAELSPSERVRFLLSILPYTAPKVERCSIGLGDFGAWD